MKYICLLLGFVVFSCGVDEEKNSIAFTFDDSAVDEWYAQRELFAKYDIRATFL